MATIGVLATGGTIAGEASRPDDGVGYRAGQRPVTELLRIPGIEEVLDGDTLQTEQIAQLDSKDMDYGTWQALAMACVRWLERPDVRAVVITHGTDTLEETAYFLWRVLGCAPGAAVWRHKPVVLACAMRPATARSPDGPQNLADALSVARDPQAQGVLVVCAGKVFDARDVQKVEPYRLDAFSGGDAGCVAYVEEGRLRWLRAPRPLAERPPRDPQSVAGLWQCLQQTPPRAWPWVELLGSHAGQTGRALHALVAAGAEGVVVVGTGNATVHRALEEVVRGAAARQDKPVIWRTTRCMQGRAVSATVRGDVRASEESIPLCPDALPPLKARIALLLELMGRRSEV